MNLRHTISVLAMALLILMPGATAFAAHHEGQPGGHAGHDTDSTATPQSAQKVNAEIRRIDAANGKVTLKHEPLTQFNMGAMTMVFRVEDPSLLSAFSVGDKVRFVPAKKNGQYVVESMEKAD